MAMPVAPEDAFFKNIRVLEIGTAVAVPLVGAVLANLGAEVIKIESAAKLDANRIRVRKAGDAAGGMDESFPFVHEFNPGKRSITLNLKTEKGRDLFLRLIEKSDVFIQNFAPGWLDRIDLPIAKLLARNPRLIMLSSSGYGQDGPKRDQRVFAPVMTALAGMESLVGDEKTGDVFGLLATAWGDFNASYLGVFAILSALYQRLQTGRGGHIDLSQVEGVVGTLGEALAEMQIDGRVPGPRGNSASPYAPRNAYPCAGHDRWIGITVTSDELWRKLIELVAEAAPDLAKELDRAAWRLASGRRADRDEIDDLLGRWTRQYEADALAEHLQAAGIACSPLLRADEVETDTQLVARGLASKQFHVTQGEMLITNTPWHFDGKVAGARAAGPLFGSDNVAVYVNLLGHSAAEVEALIQEGVLA
jgi:crotonobetainyl-CoA:carnitine CoA-transferase CaiB-like acyl-CoA transferase